MSRTFSAAINSGEVLGLLREDNSFVADLLDRSIAKHTQDPVGWGGQC